MIEKKILDISVTDEDVAEELGRLNWTILSLRKQIKILEDRVDELESNKLPRPALAFDASVSGIPPAG